MKAINAKTHEVQAILQGRRTQARCIVKPQPEQVLGHFFWKGTDGWHAELIASKCKYQPGDILYVRETWAWAEDTSYDEHVSSGGWKYKADFSDFAGAWKWRPSIHMPKEAARIFLRVKSVWVERLCDISEADAIAEGILPQVGVEDDIYVQRYENYLPNGYSVLPPIASFQSLWQSINGEESWNANPWVWAIEFERIEH